jgi:hypothetical protein
MTLRMLSLAVVYTAHHGTYVRVRKSHPWSPEHVVALAVDTQWWSLLPPNVVRLVQHPHP